jgi:predicted nucleic acid-binding protein
LTGFLLDATVWVASSDRGNAHHRAASRLIRGAALGEITVAALDLTLYEVANVAVVKWKSDADAADLVRLVRTACGDALERVDEQLVREASSLATDRGLTVYDAAYVAVSRRRGIRLVSADLADLVRLGLAISPEEAAGG